MPEKDYSKRALLTLVAVMVIMVGIMFIPSHTLGGISIRRANIVSDLVHFNDENYDSYKKKIIEHNLDTNLFEAIPEDVKESIEDEGNSKTDPEAATTRKLAGLSFIPIEDYSDDSMMYKFYNKLQDDASKRVVRIAFCGDSFIESDILTSDIREMLQEQYGGRGVGFVPFSHPLLKYRHTVSSATIGWTDYSIMKKGMTPDRYQHSFFLSGNMSIPSEEAARCYLKGTRQKKFLDYAEKAHILFRNTLPTDMSVTINDNETEVYHLEAKDSVQCITVENPKLSSICINLTKTEGFVGYGICMNGKTGIAVDNYSVRGNSGMALFYSNIDVNKQIGSYLNYDLIVLQYGLNVMVEDNLNYSRYKNDLKKLIGYIKACFPKSAILVMGVSDRSTRKSGSYKTMNSVLPMITEQHTAAMESHVAFWNTFNAMGGENSIVKFVEKGMAGKDYTHINQNGGKFIADKVYSSITSEIERMPKRLSTDELKSVDAIYPDKVTYKRDEELLAMVKADRTRHKIVSRSFWKVFRKW